MYSEDLKQLVSEHTHINKLYFTEDGRYFLSPAKYKDALFGTIVNGEPKLDTLIVKEVSRDVILNSVSEDVKSEEIKEEKPKKIKK